MSALRLSPVLGLAAACALVACAGASPERRPPEPQQESGEERILKRQKLIWYFGEEYRFVWDPEVVAPVAGTTLALARAIGAPDNRFHVYIIDRPTVNAFTSPWGDIFIFSGLLAQMNSASELAGVLAHEMAHVEANHFQRMQKKAAISSIPGIMAAILTRGDPRVVTSAIAAAQQFQLNWSREMEEESDRLALLYLDKTTYDKRGLLAALGIMARQERLLPHDVPEHLMTHPVMSSRVAALENMLAASLEEPYQQNAEQGWERMRVNLLALTDRPEAVRRQYRKRLADGTPENHDLMGILLLRQGDYAGAEKHLRQALAGDAGNPHYLADLGAALFHQGKTDEAREAFEASLRRPAGEKRSYTHYYLGEIHRKAGNDRVAHDAYRVAVEAWPPLSEAHYQLALLLAGQEQLGESDYYFGRAARLRGDFASALRSFTRAESRLGSDPAWGARIRAELRAMQ